MRKPSARSGSRKGKPDAAQAAAISTAGASDRSPRTPCRKHRVYPPPPRGIGQHTRSVSNSLGASGMASSDDLPSEEVDR